MANLVIVSTSRTVEVDFGIYANFTKTQRVAFRREEISEVIEYYESAHVVVKMLNGIEFKLSATQIDGSMIVDSIDGVAPTNNIDLFNTLHLLQ